MDIQFDPVKAAFDNAVRDFKATLADERLYDDISKTTSIDDVYQFTTALQEEQAKTGRLRHLAKIQPYLEGLRSYVDVIQVFIQVNQSVLPLIWGPIKLLLQWTNTMKRSFDAIVDVLADIGLLLPEFKQVRTLFESNVHIKDVLVLFFRDILDFYLIVLKFFRKNYWGLIFESMWPKQRERISVVKSQIERHTLLLRREVRLEHIQEAHDSQRQALEHYEKAERAFRKQEYESLKLSISPKTYEKKLDWLQGRDCPGAAIWLFKNESFSQWLDTSDSSVRVLWLQGIPGAGKTFLSSSVVHKTQSMEFTHTTYAFLSYATGPSLTALSILQSLIFQLTTAHPELQEILCQSSGETLLSSLIVAAKMLENLLICADTTYIVLDGLDEIDQIERGRLLKQLLDTSATCQSLKLLISSRAEADIGNFLKDYASIRVDTHNAGSIQRFVNIRSEGWLKASGFSDEAQASIRGLLAPVASKAEVILSSMDSLDDLKEIENELKVLPENLNAAYLRILDRINNLHHSLRSKVQRIIGWIGCSLAPLTVQEIAQALVVSREDATGSGKVIATLDMPRICGPIIEIIDGCAQFVHFTVQEYFFSPRIEGSLSLVDATADLATCCITYLSQSHHDESLSNEEVRENLLSGAYAFHDFANMKWLELVKHYVQLVRNPKESNKLIDALIELQRERSSQNYTDLSEDSVDKRETSVKLLDECPSVVQIMLDRSERFWNECSVKNFNDTDGTTWAIPDPLTLSSTSIRIHQQLEDLLHIRSGNQLLHLDLLTKFYGDRPFKCDFIRCPFRRYGFTSRSLKNSHKKDHERPWKCSVDGCEYNERRFFSRKMRDDHYFNAHKRTGKRVTPDIQSSSVEDIQPLLFDLIRDGNVDAIRKVVPLYKRSGKADCPIEAELMVSVGHFGSPAMLEHITKVCGLDMETMYTYYIRSSSKMGRYIEAFVKASNLELLKHGLQKIRGATQSGPRGPVSYRVLLLDADVKILENILKVGSVDLFNEWERDIKAFHLIATIHIPIWSMYTTGRVISATAGLQTREELLLRAWDDIGISPSSEHKYLGDALINVASATCSVRLAAFFIRMGADVDHRRSKHYQTPLRRSASKDSEQAAELTKYLLFQGADPEPAELRPRPPIRDEKGARGIAKWLGISFDDLVAEARESRGITVSHNDKHIEDRNDKHVDAHADEDNDNEIADEQSQRVLHEYVNESADEHADQNVDENADKNADELPDEQTKWLFHENTDEEADDSVDENADEHADADTDEHLDEQAQWLYNAYLMSTR